MGQTLVKKIYLEYIKDVIVRHDKVLAYQEKRKSLWQNKSEEEVKSALKLLISQENLYRKPQEIDQTNNFELLEKNAIALIIMENFADHEAVKRIREQFKKEQESVQNLPPEARKDKLKSIELKNLQKLNELYPLFKDEIEAGDMLIRFYQKQVVSREAEMYIRGIIQQEFFDKKIDASRDKGSCTKGLTVSLMKIQEKHLLQLFAPNLDIEEIIHPSELAGQLKSYIKTAPTGLIKDIEGIKIGDIIMITREDGRKGHAMMCYGFDEKNEPLLLGFSPNTKETNAYYTKHGQPRRGIVIDIKQFIEDKVKEHQKSSAKVKQKARE